MFADSIKKSSLAESMKPLSDVTAPNPEQLVEKAQTVIQQPEHKLAGKRYEGMKKMLIPLDPAEHRKLKMMAVERDMTLEKIVQEAIRSYISSSR